MRGDEYRGGYPSGHPIIPLQRDPMGSGNGEADLSLGGLSWAQRHTGPVVDEARLWQHALALTGPEEARRGYVGSDAYGREGRHSAVVGGPSGAGEDCQEIEPEQPGDEV